MNQTIMLGIHFQLDIDASRNYLIFYSNKLKKTSDDKMP